MRRATRWLMVLAYLMAATLSLPAQRQSRDPLTDAEVDQMREAADFPNKRIELLIRFTRERVFEIESLCSEPASAADIKKIHDLLQDFSIILDEIDDNIDMYTSHNADLRKGLEAAD